MKMNIWMKPDFELELFVPNHYIAACCPNGGVKVGTIAHQYLKAIDIGSYYIWLDNGNGVLDGSFENGAWVGDDVLLQENPAISDADQGIGNHKCHSYDMLDETVYLVQSHMGGPVHSYYHVRVHPSEHGQGSHHDYHLRDDCFFGPGNNS